MRETILTAVAFFAGIVSVPAATSLGIGQYKLAGAYGLPGLVDEASGVTYNWDRNSLVVVDDGGVNLIEVSLVGGLLHAVSLTGYPVQGDVNTHDAEGVTYLGNNVYMMTSERNRNVYVFSTTFPNAGETIDIDERAGRIELFGPDDDVGNSGLEGVSFDPLTSTFVGVKEKSPSEFYRFTYDPVTLAPTITQPYSKPKINAWNVDDVADVQSLGVVPVYAGTARADNFLLISQASGRLLEIDGNNGSVLGQLDLSGFAAGWNVEGVTIDFAGNVYVVGEKAAKDAPARLFVFSPVPEPSVGAFLLAGASVLIGAGGAFRRRKRTPGAARA